jgi:hypothetical protein
MSLLAHARPLHVTEIVDVSFRFYRVHAGELLVLAAVCLVPPIVVGAIVPAPVQPVVSLLGNLLYPVCQGGIALVVAARMQQDRAITAGEALRAMSGRMGAAIGTSLLAGILVMLGTLLLVIPGILVLAWTIVVVPVVVIEGLANSPAISRSRDLVRGHVWHVLGTTALAWLVVTALVLGSSLALGLLVGMFGITNTLPKLLGALTIVPTFPLVGIATTLLYFDLRVRGEGADVVAMLDSLPPVAAESGAP